MQMSLSERGIETNLLLMKKVRVFAPASIANLGCGFDIMGLALDEVGDILEMTATEGEGITITNRTDVPLPENIEDNVITPVIRKFFEMTGLSAHMTLWKGLGA